MARWWRYFSITTMVLLLRHPQLTAQAGTPLAPPPESRISDGNPLPDSPSGSAYPVAVVVPQKETGATVTLASDGPQTRHGSVVTLDQHVVITYGDHVLQADHVEYNSDTHEVSAQGHLRLSGGSNQEELTASHGEYNLVSGTGRFFDVTGSVAMRAPAARPVAAISGDPTVFAVGRTVYTSGEPFHFAGRMIVKSGPESYDVYDGSVTSCQLPDPDWLLSAAHLSLDGTRAKAHGSTFHLLHMPLLYLPYVTYPEAEGTRQSGFLIPEIGYNSQKGLILGEQIYLVINRSADLTVGAQYYSRRGWAQSAAFRYRGQNLDFVTVRYSSLLDRLQGTANQGGEDLLFAGRRDFSPNTRAAANVEYLSSYIYREAFTSNFNQAVTSDVVSTAYLVHHAAGYEFAGMADRYQGIKLIAQGSNPQQQVHILHVPTLGLSTVDLRVGPGNLQYDLDASSSGLKRTQPNFASGGVVERFDLHPELAYPFALGGWRLRPAVGARETIYSRSRVTPYVPGQPPTQSANALTRGDLEAGLDLRPPVIEREFALTGPLARVLGPEVRHTVEPDIHYRYVGGISDFLNVLRFDETDVVSNTNELEYGVTQRLFRPGTDRGCHRNELPQGPGLDAADATEPLPDTTPGKGCGNEELISWRLTQKYFFDPTFGGAVLNGRRNIFQSTLDLSGVAFLTEPREISPLVSRLRVRTSAHTDVEWDMDLDTGAKKLTADNVFVDVHRGKTFGALSYSLLDAPGRFYTSGVSSTVSSFDQMRLLLGYGEPSKPGLAIAGNTGLDLCPVPPRATATTSGTTASPSSNCNLLQYAAVQTSYNWNCCGLSIEYRKFELGSVRNDGEVRFSFTLANIGAAGNLRRAERLF